MTIKTFAVLMTGLLALPLNRPAFAQAAPAPVVVPVVVSGAWSRATPPGAEVGAVYMTLDSVGADRLVSVSSPVSATATVHEMSMSGSVMQMRELSGGLALPAHQAVTLSPGGMHIMLMGLKAPLKQGARVPLHLVFQSAPPVDIMVPVAALGAQAAPAK